MTTDRAHPRFWPANSALVGLFLSLAPSPVQAQTPTPVAIFDQPCSECHSAIFNEYLETPMANASGPAIDNLIRPSLKRTYGNVTYSIYSDTGEVLLGYSQVAPPIQGHRKLDYFLGSGHLGTTYLYRVNGYLLESPVAYYNGSGLDLKPGIPATGQLAAALPVESACLRCHMSAVQHSDPGSMNRYQGSPFLHTGITCEACHGDTSLHLSSRGKLSATNPAKLDQARRDSVCISCHLEGDASVEQPGRSALDYKPGDLISTYLSYFVFAGKDAMERGVSEVEQFNVSMCKRQTGAAMSCTTCHDPHVSPTPEQRVEFYRTKCLTCHNSTSFVHTHHTEQRDCTSCHMTKTGAANIPHVAWTDHRILRRPPQPSTLTSSSPSKELRPLLPADSTSRDLGLAYYQASFKAGNDLQVKAHQLLKEHEPAFASDPTAMDALGNIAAVRGDFAEARRDFDEALQSDAHDFSASINQGVLLARSGKLQAAIDAWAPAFARNADIPGLAMDLALAECRLGNTQAAETTLRTAFEYSPGQKQLSELLGLLHSCARALPKTKPATE